MSSRGHVASQNNTSATGAYFGHLSFYCTHTATCQLVLYVPAGRKMSVHPRPQGKQKTHRTPERIKTPLVHPASSSKKKENHPKILDSVTSKSIMEKTWENIEEEKKKTTNLCDQLQEKYHIKTSLGFFNLKKKKRLLLIMERENKVKANVWLVRATETSKSQNSTATHNTAKGKPKHSNSKSRQKTKRRTKK